MQALKYTTLTDPAPTMSLTPDQILENPLKGFKLPEPELARYRSAMMSAGHERPTLYPQIRSHGTSNASEPNNMEKIRAGNKPRSQRGVGLFDPARRASSPDASNAAEPTVSNPTKIKLKLKLKSKTNGLERTARSLRTDASVELKNAFLPLRDLPHRGRHMLNSGKLEMEVGSGPEGGTAGGMSTSTVLFDRNGETYCMAQNEEGAHAVKMSDGSESMDTASGGKEVVREQKDKKNTLTRKDFGQFAYRPKQTVEDKSDRMELDNNIPGGELGHGQALALHHNPDHDQLAKSIHILTPPAEAAPKMAQSVQMMASMCSELPRNLRSQLDSKRIAKVEEQKPRVEIDAVPSDWVMVEGEGVDRDTKSGGDEWVDLSHDEASGVL